MENAKRYGIESSYCATGSITQAKRPHHPPGYYRALHNCSSTDILAVGTGDRSHEHGKLRLHADCDLPEGRYEVKRLVAKRRRKIISTVIFMCLVCMCLYACVWGVCIC